MEDDAPAAVAVVTVQPFTVVRRGWLGSSMPDEPDEPEAPDDELELPGGVGGLLGGVLMLGGGQVKSSVDAATATGGANGKWAWSWMVCRESAADAASHQPTAVICTVLPLMVGCVSMTLPSKAIPSSYTEAHGFISSASV